MRGSGRAIAAKTAKNLVINVIIMICLLFFSEYSVEVTVANWTPDFEEWFYFFVHSKAAAYFGAVLLFSLILCLGWNLVSEWEQSLRGLMIILLCEIAGLSGCFHLYWAFVSNYCFESDDAFNIVHSFNEIYGDVGNAKCMIWGMLLFFFAAGTILVKCYSLFKEKVKKEIVWQAVSDKTGLEITICCVIPILLIWPACFRIVFLLRVSNRYLGIVFIAVIYVYWIISRYRIYRRLYDYYMDAVAKKEEYAWLVINEEYGRGVSYLYKYIFNNNNYMQLLDREKIAMLPAGIFSECIHEDTFLSLDMYKWTLQFENNEDKEAYIKQMETCCGTFCMAYCEKEDLYKSIREYYNFIYCDMESVITKIIEMKGMLLYRKRQIYLLNSLKSNCLNRENEITKELEHFRRYYMFSVNPFMVFDHSIKWIEILHYFYTLVLISILQVNAHEICRCREEYFGNKRDYLAQASFGAWKDMRERLQSLPSGNLSAERRTSYDRYNQLMTGAIRDKKILLLYNFVWGSISEEKEYFDCSTNICMNDFFAALVRVRNYTRGHGIYTFEMNTEINLALIQILVYLINRLILSGLLDIDMSNLRLNGWILSREEDTYYLYSINRREKEYEFNSFRSGTTMAVPFCDADL